MKKFEDPIETVTKDGWLGLAVWLDKSWVSWTICLTVATAVFVGLWRS